MAKCILLSRVSTEQQSLDEQTRNLKAAAEAAGFDEIVTIETKESAIKLTEEERQGLNELKSHIEKGGVECVFIWELSRLSRRPKVLYSMREYLQDHKVQLRCLHPEFTMFKEDFSLDTNANIIFGLYVSLCENEMAIKKERFHRGKEKIAREGKFSGGKFIMFGYKLDSENRYVIDENDAKLVRDIFYLYGVKKYSIRDLYVELKSRGVRKSLAGIRYTLHDERYVGKATKGRHDRNVFERKYPAIISQELFDLVQERAEAARHDNRSCEKELLAKKILKCPVCGHAMSASTRGKYVCHVHMHHRVETINCNNKCSIDIKTVEELLWHVSKKLWKWRMKEHSEEEKKRMVDELFVTREKIKTCEDELSKIETRLKRTKDLYILGDLSDKEFEDYRFSINEKKTSLTAQKDNLEDRIAYLNECIVGLNDPQESDIELGEHDFATRDKIVHECIKECTVTYADEKEQGKIIKIVSVYGESYWYKRYMKVGLESLERVVYNKGKYVRVPKKKEEDF